LNLNKQISKIKVKTIEGAVSYIDVDAVLIEPGSISSHHVKSMGIYINLLSINTECNDIKVPVEA
jgi:hypothetical protein